MNYLKKFVLPLIIAAGILVLLISVRTIPVSKLWKNYTVLSVPKKADVSVVNQVLTENGVKNFISLENHVTEVFPVVLSLEKDSYVESKNAYFFDRSGKTRLFYIPDNQKRNALKAVDVLRQSYRISADMDSRSSFPWLTPVIALITAAIFFVLSKNRIVYSIPALYVVVFAFSNPFVSNAAAACLIFFLFYIFQKIWGRKDMSGFLRKNPVLLSFTVFPVLLSFTVSFISGAFFILSLAGALAGLVLYYFAEEYREGFYDFHPVLIRSAFSIRPMNLKSLKHMLLCSVGILSLILLFLVTGSFSSSNSGDLSIPCPEEYNVSRVDFVNLDDYFIWKWNNLTASYRSINKVYAGFPEEGEEVSVQHFKRTEKGISTSTEVLYRYDEAFRKKVLNDIDHIEQPCLEKLWKSEGRNFSVGYSSGKQESLGAFSLVMLIISMLMPCSAACYYILEWRRKAYVS